MSDEKRDFFDGLKVSNLDQQSVVNSTFSDRDIYTCIKLMGDTAKVNGFLTAESLKQDDEHKLSTDHSSNYYYSINHGIAEAEYAFRKGIIDINQLNSQINSVCRNHNLNFSHLIEFVNEIDALSKSPDQNKSIQLAQEIENSILELREKQTGVEK